MMSSWRRRRSSRRAGKQSSGGLEVAIPSQFRCPISLDLMKDPVTLTTGITYDRHGIETWIESGNATCPSTKQVLRSLEPVPNHALRRMIQDWCVQNKSLGVERIPTPRIPITSAESDEVLSRIAAAGDRTDAETCRELVSRLRAAMRESDRNRRCVAGRGAARRLSAAFEAFAGDSASDGVSDEILSALVMVSPIADEEAKASLGSDSSLRCLVRFLEAGDLSRRRNSVLVAKQVVSSSSSRTSSFSRIDGALEALVRILREPICPASTKAALSAICHVAALPDDDDGYSAREKLVRMGLVSLALEMLVDSDKSVCEKALAVLDGLAQCRAGRAEARRNALAVPVLVKKILRVSDLSTELSISVLWKLCCKRNDDDDNDGELENDSNNAVVAAVEALQVGAFQKLLLVLQVGCGERVRENTSELLKVLNLHRGKVECIDSMDFKDLKRPF